MNGVGLLFQVGLFCFLLALVIGGIAVLRDVTATMVSTCFASLASLSALLWFRRQMPTVKRQRAHFKARKNSNRDITPFVAELTPQLYGGYVPYVVEAAQLLGEARDMTAVPDLCAALEICVNTQKPGWRDASAALADSLAQIGDARALPLLYKLENVRGIGFIPNIRSAIARIEPHSSLLRPGSSHDAAQTGTLLRPLPNRDSIEPPSQLLRSSHEE